MDIQSIISGLGPGTESDDKALFESAFAPPPKGTTFYCPPPEISAASAEFGVQRFKVSDHVVNGRSKGVKLDFLEPEDSEAPLNELRNYYHKSYIIPKGIRDSALENFNHDFTFLGVCNKTDTPLKEHFSVKSDGDDDKTPDFICKNEDNVYVVEFTTRRTSNDKILREAFSSKIEKYSLMLKRRLDPDITISFYVVVVGINAVCSNLILDQKLINNFVNRYKVARSVDGQMIRQGLKAEVQDEDRLATYKAIRTMMTQIDLRFDEDRVGVRIPEWFTDLNNKLNSGEQVLRQERPNSSENQIGLFSKLFYQKCLEPANERNVREVLNKLFVESLQETNDLINRNLNDENWVKMSKRVELVQSSAQEKFSKLDGVEYREVSDHSSVVKFPGIVLKPQKGNLNANSYLRVCDLGESQEETFLLIKDCLIEVEEGRVVLPVSDASEELDLALGATKYTDKEKKDFRQSVFRASTILETAQMRELAKLGVNGKTFSQDPEVLEYQRLKKRPFCFEHNVDFIDHSLEKLSKTGFEDMLYPLDDSMNYIHTLLMKASSIHDIPNRSIENFTCLSKTALANLCRLVTEVAIELCLSLRQNVKKDVYIIKKLKNYNLTLVIKPTNSTKHLFYTLMWKSSDAVVLDRTTFRDFFDNGSVSWTPFSSTSVEKLENWVKCSSTYHNMFNFYLDFYGELTEANDAEPMKFLSYSPSEGQISARKMTLLSILILLSDKRQVDAALILYRFIAMESFVTKPAYPCPEKMIAKFPNFMRSPLEVWVYKKLLGSIVHLIKTPVRPMMNEEGFAKVSGLWNPYLEEPLENVQQLISLFYIGYLKNKDESGKTNTKAKLYEKIIEYEEKFKGSFECLGFVNPETVGHHEFDPDLLKACCDAARKDVERDVSVDFDKHFEEEIINSLLRLDISEVATLKASSTFNEKLYTMTPENTDKKRLLKYSRVKVIQAIKPKIDEISNEDIHFMDLVTPALEELERKGCMHIDLFRKQQHGDLREIYVLGVEERIVQLVFETISKTICRNFVGETMTHPQSKNSIPYQHIIDTKTYMDSKGEIHYISADAAKWNQNHHINKFVMMLLRLTPKIFHGFIFRVGRLWLNKRILIDPEVLRKMESCSGVLKSSCGVLNKMVSAYHGLEKVSWMIPGTTFITTSTGMMQGILHYTSSLLHVLVLNYLKKVCLILGRSFMENAHLTELKTKYKSKLVKDLILRKAHETGWVDEEGRPLQISDAYNRILELPLSEEDLTEIENLYAEGLDEEVEMDPGISKCGIIISYLVSSDDSGILMSFNLKDINKTNAANLAFCLSRMKVKLSERLSIIDSVKTTSNTLGMFEFNSEFYYNGFLYRPTFRWVAACLSISEQESLAARQEEMSNLLTSVLEGAGCINLVQKCQISQALLHYNLMGLTVSPVFEQYVKNSLTITDPALGFFLLDHPMMTGFCGFSYNLWACCRRTELGLIYENLITKSLVEVKETTNLAERLRAHNSLSMEEVERSRTLLAMSATDAGTFVHSTTISHGNRQKWSKLIANSGYPLDWAEYMTRNPEVLFRKPITKTEVLNTLSMKLHSPGVSESLSSGNSVGKTVAAGVYGLSRDVLNKGDVWFGSFEEVTEEKVSGCLKERLDVSKDRWDEIVENEKKFVVGLKKHLESRKTNVLKEQLLLVQMLNNMKEGRNIADEDVLDMSIGSEAVLFPRCNEYRELTNRISNFKRYTAVPKKNSDKKLKSSVDVFEIGEASMLSLLKICSCKWFGIGSLPISSSTVNMLFSERQKIITWLKDTFEESLLASPFKEVHHLQAFLSRFVDKTRMVRLVGSPVSSRGGKANILSCIKYDYFSSEAIRPIDEREEVEEMEVDDQTVEFEDRFVEINHSLLMLKYMGLNKQEHLQKAKMIMTNLGSVSESVSNVYGRRKKMRIMTEFLKQRSLGDSNMARVLEEIQACSLGTVGGFTLRQRYDSGLNKYVGDGEWCGSVNDVAVRICIKHDCEKDVNYADSIYLNKSLEKCDILRDLYRLLEEIDVLCDRHVDRHEREKVEVRILENKINLKGTPIIITPSMKNVISFEHIYRMKVDLNKAGSPTLMALVSRTSNRRILDSCLATYDSNNYDLYACPTAVRSHLKEVTIVSYFLRSSDLYTSIREDVYKDLRELGRGIKTWLCYKPLAFQSLERLSDELENFKAKFQDGNKFTDFMKKMLDVALNKIGILNLSDLMRQYTGDRENEWVPPPGFEDEMNDFISNLVNVDQEKIVQISESINQVLDEERMEIDDVNPHHQIFVQDVNQERNEKMLEYLANEDTVSSYALAFQYSRRKHGNVEMQSLQTLNHPFMSGVADKIREAFNSKNDSIRKFILEGEYFSREMHEPLAELLKKHFGFEEDHFYYSADGGPNADQPMDLEPI